MIRAALIAFLAAILFAPAHAQQSVLDADSIYPEAAQFIGNALYVAELPTDRVLVYEKGKKRVFFYQDGCGPASVRPYRNGLAIFCHIRGELVFVDKNGLVTGQAGRGVLRDPNDGAPDGSGGLYLSDPGLFSKDTRATGEIYHLTVDGALQVVAKDDLWYPNGIYVEGNQLYLSETFRRKVWRYTIAANGALTGKTLYLDIDKIAPRSAYNYREAGPDGLARAPNGELVVAIYGEGRLLRIDRDGKFVGQIDVPFQYVDNVAFGKPGAVVLGAYDNINPPMRGEVRWWKP